MGGIKGYDAKERLLIFKVGLSDDPRTHILNRLVCLSFCLLTSIWLGTKGYVSSLIQCWCPAQITESQVLYINNYCWVRNTYYVDFNQSFPLDIYSREQTEISYYQWTPLILLFQAMLFYVPRMFWLAFTGYSSLNLKKLLLMAQEASLQTGNKRSEIIDGTVDYFVKYIKLRNCITARYKTTERLKESMESLGFHKGNVLVFIFLATSFLYTASTVLQFWMVDALLRIDFKTLGYDFVHRVIKGESFNDQRRFPVVSFCDFDIRQMTNVQTWTVQCSLPLIFFSEKVFIVDWFILVLMTFVNIIYFMYNMISTVLPYRARNYVKKFLEVDGVRLETNQKVPEHLNESQYEFVHSYLRRDGVFIIWLISNKVSHVIASEIVSGIWKKYKK